MLSCFAVAFVIKFLLTSGVSGWHHKVGVENGPEHWYINYSDCGGVMQSPIDINTSRVLYDPNLQPFNFTEYNVTDGVELELENLGFTAQVYLKGTKLFISGGGLPTKYRLMLIHFHWRGEHLINGEFYPAEITFIAHISSPVSYHRTHKENLSTVHELRSTGEDPIIHFVHGQHGLEMPGVVTHPFGQAVVAFFLKLGKKNVNYDPLFKYFSDIRASKARRTIPTFPIGQLLPASDRYDFFRYFGSLTTPPCWESVIWSVAEPVIEVSQEQLDAFKLLYNPDENELTNTWRPVQKLNNRTILTTNGNHSKIDAKSSRNTSCNCPPAFSVCLWILLHLFNQVF